MSLASTIVIAREDLSIAGSEHERLAPQKDRHKLESRFFALLEQDHPDVIVLDLTNTQGAGLQTIRKIRQACDVPILVICDEADPDALDYRVAGAAECLFSPVYIAQLNCTIQRIIRVTRVPLKDRGRSRREHSFAGVTHFPDRNELRAGTASIRLTTAENDLLTLLIARSRRVCSRAEIATVVYGNQRPVTDRAIDVLVNRLRKKLASACGPLGENPIKTEFRRGYVFIAEIPKGLSERERSVQEGAVLEYSLQHG